MPPPHVFQRILQLLYSVSVISLVSPCHVPLLGSVNVRKYHPVTEYSLECPFINLTSKAQHQTLRGVNTLAGMSGHAEKKTAAADRSDPERFPEIFESSSVTQCFTVFHCVNNLKEIPVKF